MQIPVENTGGFVQPDGEIIQLPKGSLHIQDIIKRPWIYKLDFIKDVRDVFEKHGELHGMNSGLENKARHEIIENLCRKGWVHFRYKKGVWAVNVCNLNTSTRANVLKLADWIRRNYPNSSGAVRLYEMESDESHTEHSIDSILEKK